MPHESMFPGVYDEPARPFANRPWRSTLRLALGRRLPPGPGRGSEATFDHQPMEKGPDAAFVPLTDLASAETPSKVMAPAVLEVERGPDSRAVTRVLLTARIQGTDGSSEGRAFTARGP